MEGRKCRNQFCMNLISGDFDDFFWKDIAGFRRKPRQTKEYSSCSILSIAENLLPEMQEASPTLCVANGKHVGTLVLFGKKLISESSN